MNRKCGGIIKNTYLWFREKRSFELLQNEVKYRISLVSKSSPIKLKYFASCCILARKRICYVFFDAKYQTQKRAVHFNTTGGRTIIGAAARSHTYNWQVSIRIPPSCLRLLLSAPWLPYAIRGLRGHTFWYYVESALAELTICPW